MSEGDVSRVFHKDRTCRTFEVGTVAPARPRIDFSELIAQVGSGPKALEGLMIHAVKPE